MSVFCSDYKYGNLIYETVIKEYDQRNEQNGTRGE